MKNLLENPLSRKIIIWLSVIVAVIIVFDFVILPFYVSGSEIKVPNVIGMSESDAISNLEDEGFDVIIADTSFGVSLPVGSVFLQKPGAGNIVKEGRTIYLFLSGGDQLISVPVLKGKSIRDAKFALERIGLKLGKIEETTSSFPKDMIFDQQFAEGTNIKKGQSVSVTVSIGKGLGEIIVPDLIGKSLSEAKNILVDSSLTVGKINFQISNTLLPNTVLDQYPAPGNKLNSRDAVDLFITKEGTLPEAEEYQEEN